MKKTAKKLTALAVAFTLLLPVLRAQSTFTTDTTFNTQMNLAFSPLDKTKVPYGILLDYAMEFTGLSAYNGTILADSTKTTNRTVPDIYNTEATAEFTTACW